MTDKVKAALTRIGNESNLDCLARQLRAIAAEDAVMEMMADAYEAPGNGTEGMSFQGSNMRAAMLALAEKCR